MAAFLVTIYETREYEVYVDEEDIEDEGDASNYAEEIYVEDGVLWSIDCETVNVKPA